MQQLRIRKFISRGGLIQKFVLIVHDNEDGGDMLNIMAMHFKLHLDLSRDAIGRDAFSGMVLHPGRDPQ